MRCTECGGRVIEDRELVCEDCGLVQGQILQSKKRSPYLNTRESSYRKENRGKKMRAEERTAMLDTANRFNMKVNRELHKPLKAYAKKHKMSMVEVASKAIMSYINRG